MQIANDIEAILAPIATAGGLYAHPNGTPPDPGYLVNLGPTDSTAASIQRGEIRAAIELSDSPIAALIKVRLVKVRMTLSLSVKRQ
jgi:hypothetical protein